MHDRPPNLLFLFPDQWRWDWLGCERSPYGNVPMHTPNIDRLAERGVRFTTCRSNAPLCAPARACLVQGVRYHRCAVSGNDQCTPVDRPNVFKDLQRLGYHTMTCGKSDLFKPDTTPTTSGYLPMMNDLGFTDGIDHRGKGDAIKCARAGIDEPYTVMLRERGLLETHLEDHPDAPLARPAYPTPLPRDAYTDDFCGSNALELMTRAPQDKPWCLWVNFPGPHDPFDPPAESLEAYHNVTFPPPVAPTDHPPAHRDASQDRLHYAGACTNIDDWVGRLIQQIERRGELERTIIVFASDHGEMLGDHGCWGKSVWHEGSVRVPLIVAGPGISSRGVSHEPVELIDLAATLVELGGGQTPHSWDSRSLVPLLRQPELGHRGFAVSQLGGWRSIADRRWKLVVEEGAAPKLFDLENDPQELNDLAPQQRELVQRMSALLESELAVSPVQQA